jgi:hypothetical protein
MDHDYLSIQHFADDIVIVQLISHFPQSLRKPFILEVSMVPVAFSGRLNCLNSPNLAEAICFKLRIHAVVANRWYGNFDRIFPAPIQRKW